MNTEALTLYKLIILYMLNKVDFPLTKAQVGDFIFEKEYTNFLTLQQAIAELIDSKMIAAKPIGNRTHLLITEEGVSTLSFFGNRISDAIKDDVKQYMHDHELTLRNEVSILTNYYKSTSGDYEAHLSAKEKDEELIHLMLSVPTEDTAAAVCDNWQKYNQEIYQYLISKLFT